MAALAAGGVQCSRCTARSTAPRPRSTIPIDTGTSMLAPGAARLPGIGVHRGERLQQAAAYVAVLVGPRSKVVVHGSTSVGVGCGSETRAAALAVAVRVDGAGEAAPQRDGLTYGRDRLRGEHGGKARGHIVPGPPELVS
jgi:hypothetical protein